MCWYVDAMPGGSGEAVDEYMNVDAMPGGSGEAVDECMNVGYAWA